MLKLKEKNSYETYSAQNIPFRDLPKYPELMVYIAITSSGTADSRKGQRNGSQVVNCSWNETNAMLALNEAHMYA